MQRDGKAFELVLAVAALVFLSAGFARALVTRAAGVPPPALERPAAAWRIVTWNVGRGFPDGALSDEAVEHVADTLAALDPDLCFLQELDDRRQLGRLARALGVGREAVASHGGGDRRVALLARRGTLEPLELEGIPGRHVGALWEHAGRTLACIDVHADAFSSRKRNAELGALARQLAEIRADARVLAGDINLDLDLGKRRDLFSDDENLDVETYNFVAGTLGDAARGTGATAEPDRRLDYVFVDPRLRVSAAGPFRGRRAAGMDHDPVVVDVDWRR
jgi:endonuclease/exonuclease/phosphatase family metal-dependent hydrolase